MNWSKMAFGMMILGAVAMSVTISYPLPAVFAVLGLVMGVGLIVMGVLFVFLMHANSR